MKEIILKLVFLPFVGQTTYIIDKDIENGSKQINAIRNAKEDAILVDFLAVKGRQQSQNARFSVQRECSVTE